MAVKNYLANGINLTGDPSINPAPPETRHISQVQRIIIHHDAEIRPHDYDTVARIRRQAQVHAKNGLGSFAYHYVIDNVGQIYHCRPLHYTTWHCGNLHWNRNSIAIKLDGYFHGPHNQKPTREQYEALMQLLEHLCTQHPEFPADQDDVFGHKEVGSTVCPGDTFQWFPPHYREVQGRVQVPADLVYDWPSLQPQNDPKPAPVVTTPVEQQPEATPVLYRVLDKNRKQLAAYKVLANAINRWNGLSGGFIIDSNGRDVTPPPPEPPKAPQPTNPPDTDEILGAIDAQGKRLSALESFVAKLKELLAKIGINL